MDAVVHLAVAIGEGIYETPQIPVQTNILGTINLMEAIRRSNQNIRVILTGSAPVHLEPMPDTKIHAVDNCYTTDGDFLYDFTKCMQERTLKTYCQQFNLTAITLRAGHIVDSHTQTDPQGRPLTDLPYYRGGWVCHYDLAGAVVKAITFQQSGYNAFHIIGAWQARNHFDIERTENEFGFVCEAHFEEYESKTE